jgi:hypothetical protein
MKLMLNTKWAARSAKRVSSVWCLLCIAGLTAPPLQAQDVTGSSGWQFAATVYAWLPDIGGNTELPLGGGSTINVDVSTILDHLKMTGQGSFEVLKGRRGAITDIVYLDVGDSNSRTQNVSIGGVTLPATVTADTDFDLKSTIWSLAASYRVVASGEAAFDLLAGARLAHLEQNLKWTFTGDFGAITPPPLTGSANASVDQWDAIVGGKGRITFGTNHRWAVPYYFDIGTGDSDLTWQAMLGLTYSFGWGDIGAAWRYLDYDLNSGPIKDLNFNGPAVGAMFRW